MRQLATPSTIMALIGTISMLPTVTLETVTATLWLAGLSNESPPDRA